MEKNNLFSLDNLAAAIVTSLIWVLVMMVFSDKAYERGQIDAVTGKMRYVLITNVDSTKTWQKIK